MLHGHILAFEANASSSGSVLGATRSGSVSCASGRDGSLCQISLWQAPARAQKQHPERSVNAAHGLIVSSSSTSPTLIVSMYESGRTFLIPFQTQPSGMYAQTIASLASVVLLRHSACSATAGGGRGGGGGGGYTGRAR